MNIKIGRPNPFRQAPSEFVKLNESQQPQPQQPQPEAPLEPLNQQDAAIADVFNIKSKQFKFDSGKIMASLTAELNDIPFSLKYHANNTASFEEFLKSVQNFIGKLTENDIAKLQSHYGKHHA